MSKKEVSSVQFTGKLLTSGLEFKATGETIDNALENLGLKWNNIKAKGVLTITKGKLKVEKLYVIVQLRRIFANKISRATEAKRLMTLLK
jgi:hypothetical protein